MKQLNSNSTDQSSRAVGPAKIQTPTHGSIHPSASSSLCLEDLSCCSPRLRSGHLYALAPITPSSLCRRV